jgi:hypothetical protein
VRAYIPKETSASAGDPTPFSRLRGVTRRETGGSRENALDTMARYGRRVPDDVDKSSLSADLITAERQR